MYIIQSFQANKRRLSNVVLMLGQRQRRWPNMKTILDEHLVFTVIIFRHVKTNAPYNIGKNTPHINVWGVFFPNIPWKLYYC